MSAGTVPEEERLQAVLNWMLKYSGCHVWHGCFSQRLAETPEPLRSMVAEEINAVRKAHGVPPL
jgi:hypothetical protein